MASPVPAKSQPLHNFSLPLKWSKNHTSNHQRGRRHAGSSSPPPDSSLRQSPSSDSAPRRQSPLLDSRKRQSPMRDAASESISCYASEKPKTLAPERGGDDFLVSPSVHVIEKSEKRSAASDVDGAAPAGVTEARSKIYIRLRTKSKADDVQDDGKKGTLGGEVEDSEAKTWNLRPRKPIYKLSNASGGTSKGGGASLQEGKTQVQQVISNRQDSNWLRSSPGAEAAEKKGKKQKFSVPLLRQEIEEDIYAMTESKPARRPKKRAKAVQKTLDNLFPGLWLASITPDSYKVSEYPAKV